MWSWGKRGAKLKDKKANTKHSAESRKGTIPEAWKEVRWSSLPPPLLSFPPSRTRTWGRKKGGGVPDRRNDTSKGAEAGTNKPRSENVDRETCLVPGFTGGVTEE